MKFLRTNAATLFASVALCSAPLLIGASQAVDNTKTNKQDISKPTADQAKNNPTDRDLMQKIRKSVMADKALSTYAHNVKIVAQNGKVTLSGPVRTDEEKQTVEQKATEVAGAGNVVDQLTIKPAKTN